MAWKKQKCYWWSDDDSMEYREKQREISEAGTRYRRKASHKKKAVSHEEQQKREWRKSKSQFRTKGWNRHWKTAMKYYIGGYYRAWVRENIARENWDAFIDDNVEFKYQEDPWSWD